MNDTHCLLNEVETELKFLESRFLVEYRYYEGKIFNIGLKGDTKKILKLWDIKKKELVKLLDWLEEPSQLECVNYIKKEG